MEKYFVQTPVGELMDSDLTAAEAAHLILSYDGRNYEFRRGADGEGLISWELFAQQRQQAPLTRVLVGFSYAEDLEVAQQEIFQAVVADSVTWHHSPQALPMALFADHFGTNDED